MLKKELSPLRLLAVDLDGTCLDSKDHLHETTLLALRRALDAGVAVVPTTGRNLLGVPKSLRTLPGVRYVITSNGAAIYDLQADQTVYERLIPYAKAADLMERCQAHGAPQAVTIGKNIIDGNPLVAKIRHSHFHDFEDSLLTRDLPDYVRECSADVEKLHILYLRKWKCDHILDLLRRELGISFSGTPGEHTEVVAAGVNKGNALAHLCALLGVAPEETAAIGDSDNDVEMLRFAGRSFAMGSAPDYVKQAAKEETDDSDHDGVAHAVQRLLDEWTEAHV